MNTATLLSQELLHLCLAAASSRSATASTTETQTNTHLSFSFANTNQRIFVLLCHCSMCVCVCVCVCVFEGVLAYSLLLCCHLSYNCHPLLHFLPLMLLSFSNEKCMIQESIALWQKCGNPALTHKHSRTHTDPDGLYSWRPNLLHWFHFSVNQRR